MAKRKKKKNLTIEQARVLFRYENGKLYWKTTRFIGKRVGTSSRFSSVVEYNGETYQLRRIVYLLHHGIWPERLDYKDKTLTVEGMYDISIENLFVPPKKVKIKKPIRKLKEDISFFEANKYFEYKQGRLYWKEKTQNGKMFIGQLAGGRSRDSHYLRVKLHKKPYMQHRIVYLLHHGHCPECITFIDKTLTDGGFYDISIENLKAITFSLSKSKARYNIRSKTSKYRGVFFDKEVKKYRVNLSANRVTRFGGHFANEVDAARKYDEMARQFVGEDAVLNFPDEKPMSTSNP